MHSPMEKVNSCLITKKKRTICDNISKVNKRKKHYHKSQSKLKNSTNMSFLNPQEKKALEALRQLEQDEQKQVWQSSTPAPRNFKSLSLIIHNPHQLQTPITKKRSRQISSTYRTKTQQSIQIEQRKCSKTHRNVLQQNIKYRECMTVKNILISDLSPQKQTHDIQAKEKNFLKIQAKEKIQRPNTAINDSYVNKKSIQLKHFQHNNHLNKNKSFILKKPHLTNRNKIIQEAKIKLSHQYISIPQVDTLIEFVRRANQESQLRIAQLKKIKKPNEHIFTHHF